MGSTTENFGLHKPSRTDFYDIEVFNENADIVDALLKEHENSINVITQKIQKRVFKTLEEMRAWLSDETNKGVASIGDLLYIEDDDAPDWWIETVRGNPNPDGFYYDIKKVGADALVVMHNYIPVGERIKGSLYLQLGKTRNLIIRVFRKFFNREHSTNDTDDTITFKQSTEKTVAVSDGNKYRFLCKNLSILEEDDTTERLEGKIYFVTK